MNGLNQERIMRKAQNVVEIGLLLSLVVVVAITAMTLYNNQKHKLVNLSKSNINQQSVDLTSLSPLKTDEMVPYNQAETAGVLSLELLGMNATDFANALSNLTYGQLNDLLNSPEGQDIADLANGLIDSLGLNYPDITATNVTVNTLSDLVGILNAIVGSDPDHPNPNLLDTTSAESLFLARFQALINLAGSSIGIETGGTVADPNDPNDPNGGHKGQCTIGEPGC